MATVLDVINKAYTKVNGEFEVQVEGSDDFKTYLNVLNQCLEMWAHTPYVKWQSLFDMTYQLADAVELDKLQYDFPDMDRVVVGNTPLDSIYFVDDDGGTVKKYKMVDQPTFQASTAQNICMLASDGLHLKSVSEELVDTHIQLPAYLLPEVYTTAAQTVRVDSIPWLITAMAAFICDASPVPFIARNADKFYKQAEIYMKTMRDNNRHRQTLSIKGTSNMQITSLSQAIAAGVGIGGGSFDIIDGGEA
jgi:hypothetical protein